VALPVKSPFGVLLDRDPREWLDTCILTGNQTVRDRPAPQVGLSVRHGMIAKARKRWRDPNTCRIETRSGHSHIEFGYVVDETDVYCAMYLTRSKVWLISGDRGQGQGCRAAL